MLYDYCVIGGGIVGIATAVELGRRHPGAGIVVIEKEDDVARHQTGHNSGVVHAGVYYKPGSLKARLSKQGAADTEAFCRAQGIAYERRGKLVVATSTLELERLKALHLNAQVNELAVQWLEKNQLETIEPSITGVAAMLVEQTGIVDYAAVCRALLRILIAQGGLLRCGNPVTRIEEQADEVVVSTEAETIRCRRLVACAGLQSDRVARMAKIKVDFAIVPFRGEYYDVRPEKRNVVRHLIYPVPDPALPFLGIHLTPMIDGGLTVGPNAVLGLAREGYGAMSVNARDIVEMVAFRGFWSCIGKSVGAGVTELRRSLFKTAYLKACRAYAPGLQYDDLIRREAGIRAQAVLRDGTLVHDFLFRETPRSLHVCNAPSPAATSAMPIARLIVARLDERGEIA